MQSSDIRFFHGLVRSDGDDNGGRMSASEITSGSPGAVWDVIRSAQRLAETVEIEKVFCKLHASDNAIGYYPKVFLDGDCSLGDDFASFWAGGQEDTQADIAGTEQHYVAGSLKTAVAATDQTLVVAMKDASQTAAWINGGTVRISNKVPFNGSGNEVFLTVNAAPSISGLDVTLQFSEQIGAVFSADSLVSMVYEPVGNVEPTIDTTSYTGGANGDFDAITMDDIGTVEQDWVGTILAGGTTYSLVGDVLGNVGTGSIASDFAPQNSDWSRPLLTIPSSFFDGLTLSEGDTFSFSTHPAAVPIWLKKTNPADAEITNSNSLWLVMRVEN